jgi:hypothetical protein
LAVEEAMWAQLVAMPWTNSNSSSRYRRVNNWQQLVKKSRRLEPALKSKSSLNPKTKWRSISTKWRTLMSMHSFESDDN